MFGRVAAEKRPETIQELAGLYPDAVGDPSRKFNLRLAPDKRSQEGLVVTNATLYPQRGKGVRPGEIVAYGLPEGSDRHKNYAGSTRIVDHERLWST